MQNAAPKEHVEDKEKEQPNPLPPDQQRDEPESMELPGKGGPAKIVDQMSEADDSAEYLKEGSPDQPDGDPVIGFDDSPGTSRLKDSAPDPRT